MSKKHFIALAEAIRGISSPAERERMAELIAGVCQQCNSNFNRARFLAACNTN